jgi:hypothetical protein
MQTILSSIVGDNSDLLPLVFSIYVPEGSYVADVTYGKGVFWKNIDRTKYTVHTSDIKDGIDCRNLPLQDSSYDCLILDPPYVYSPKGTMKESISECYKNNGEHTTLLRTQKDVINLYFDALTEAWRVLKTGGYALVKTQDVIQSGKQVWMHKLLMDVPGFTTEDLFVLTQKSIPAMDPKWPRQYHARKNHSFLLVLRKLATREEKRAA